MINLIPPAQKQDIAYGRKNNMLVKWVAGSLIALIGLAIIGGGCLFYLQQDSKTYQASIDEAKSNLKTQNETETLARVGEISGRLNLVVDVLSKEVVFSELIPHLGSLMPEGAILRDLSINREQTGAIDLSIGAVNEFSASQALKNIQSSDDSLIFRGADANTINCEGADDQAPYICTATITAVLTDTNPFLLLNQGAKDE